MAKTTKTTKKSTAKRTTKKDPLKVLRARYSHIKSVAATGVKGKITRVNVQCTNRGCSEMREIATQDAFQVKRCTAHQREYAMGKRRKTPIAA